MLVLKLAIRGLGRNPRTSIALVGIVTIGVFLFILGDSFIASAASGSKAGFQNCYTGDLAIRAKFDRGFGIFGFNVPNISEYEDIPTLKEVSAIRAILGKTGGVAASAALVSGAALLQGPKGYEVKVPVFGVKAKEYFDFFPALHFIKGAIPSDNEAWIVLPTSRAEEIGKAEGRSLAIGDTFQLTMATNTAFTIRMVRLAGVVDAPFHFDDAVVPIYADAVTLRALLGLAQGPTDPQEKAAKAADLDLSSFFDAPGESLAPPTKTGEEEARGLDLVSSYLGTEVPQQVRPDPELGAWHFVLIRLSSGPRGLSARWAINAALGAAGIDAVALDWLSVAGLNASILSMLSTVFMVGICVLSAVVCLVLTNGLAFAVIEQMKEIGTMRAMGAQVGLVRRIYFSEACILVGSGAALGGLAAALVLIGIGAVGIPIGNSYLIQLFGVTRLKPSFSTSAVLLTSFGCVMVALISSFYPLSVATKMTIAETMTVE